MTWSGNEKEKNIDSPEMGKESSPDKKKDYDPSRHALESLKSSVLDNSDKEDVNDIEWKIDYDVLLDGNKKELQGMLEGIVSQVPAYDKWLWVRSQEVLKNIRKSADNVVNLVERARSDTNVVARGAARVVHWLSQWR